MGRSELVLCDIAGGVATLTLNRPDALNAWTPEMEERWNALLDHVVAAPQVRAIVVTGAGRGFCPGADSSVLGRRSLGHEATPERTRPLSALADVPKPVVAAINGACIGLGLALALCCDVRFAAHGAKLAASFARRGLLAEFGTPWLLPRVVGHANAMDLLLSGRTVLAEEALTLGLVNRVVPAGELLGVAQAYAADMAEHCSPLAMAKIKAQVRAAFIEGPGDERTRRIADFAEGMASLSERRAPDFAPLDPKDAPWE